MPFFAAFEVAAPCCSHPNDAAASSGTPGWSRRLGSCDLAISPLWFCDRWLDLENFMRIFRQQGHPWALEKIWFLIKSIFDPIKARAANGRAGIWTMFLRDSEASGTSQEAPASLSQLGRRTPPGSIRYARPPGTMSADPRAGNSQSPNAIRSGRRYSDRASVRSRSSHIRWLRR